MGIDVSFLDELNRFRMIMKKKVISQYQGGKESTMPGGGLVFKDYSMYSAGDDFRTIDWKVYARTEKLFVRRFEEERNMLMHIILDASSSMNFGSPVKKFDYAAMIGLGFAFMSMKENGRYSFATFSDKLDILNVGSKDLIKIVDHINRLKIGGQTKLVDSMENYRKNIRSKSSIILISDFLYELDEIKEILLRYRKNYVRLVQVLDPVEAELDLKGDVILKDMESSASLRTYVSSRFRDQYKKRLADHVLEIKDLCSHFRFSFITVTTDTPIFETFYNILFSPM